MNHKEQLRKRVELQAQRMKQAEKELRFSTWAMPVLFHPYILEKKQYLHLKSVTEIMLSITEKAVGIFLSEIFSILR